MKKGVKIVIVLLVVALAVGVAATYIAKKAEERRIDRAYDEAWELYKAGRYEEASEIYKALGDWNRQEDCRRGIVDRQALELLEQGKPQEAFDLLKQENPKSDVREQVVLAVAADLAGQGDPEAAAKLLSDERAGDKQTRLTYDMMAAEQDLRSSLETDNIAHARTMLEKIEDISGRIDGGKTDAELQAMREEIDAAEQAKAEKKVRQAAEEALAEGNYQSAFDRYLELGDAEGMQAAVDTMLERNEAVSDWGNLECKNMFATLLAEKDDAANALAQKLAEGVVGECQALAESGKRSVAWRGLGDLELAAGALWTDEWQELMDGLEEPLPAQNKILSDEGLAVQSGDSGGQATITVINKKGRAAILEMTQVNTSGNKHIAVYVRPASQYTFTIRSGKYLANVRLGLRWFGDEEGFGFGAESQRAEVNNGPNTPKQRDWLEGSYSITLQ